MEAASQKVFDSKDLVLECIGAFLTTRELSNFLCVNKKTYSFSPPHIVVIRKCYSLYGLPVKNKSSRGWIKYCIKAHCLPALRYVLEKEILELEYLAYGHHISRHSNLGLALIECNVSGIKNAAKYGTAEILSFLVDWYAYLRSLNNGDVRHAFDAGYKITLSQVSRPAILFGIEAGNASVAMQLMDTKRIESIETSYPIDDAKNQEWARNFIHVVVSSGNQELFPYAVEQLESFYSPKTLSHDSGKKPWAYNVLIDLLKTGRSVAFIPYLRNHLKYECDGTPSAMIGYALKNPNPVMLEYVMSTCPKDQLAELKRHLKYDYREQVTYLRETCFALSQYPDNTRLLKSIERIQKRIVLLKHYLTVWYNVDWKKFQRNPTSAVSEEMQNNTWKRAKFN